MIKHFDDIISTKTVYVGCTSVVIVVIWPSLLMLLWLVFGKKAANIIKTSKQ